MEIMFSIRKYLKNYIYVYRVICIKYILYGIVYWIYIIVKMKKEMLVI